MMRRLWIGLLLLLPLSVFAAGGLTIPLEHVKIDPTDMASLQRGAQIYVNYCQSCHSLKYMRYNRLAQGLGIVGKAGKVDAALVKDHLIFAKHVTVFDTMQSAMPAKLAKRWFGVAPPDLTLTARVHGVDWLYTYLINFYQDKSKPWGTNNRLFPDVAMPNVLESLQGVQVPVYRKVLKMVDGKRSTKEVFDHLEIVKLGSMGTVKFDHRVRDLVNFLAFVAEPGKVEQHRIGYWVLGVLVILIILSYLLKKEYWRDIKK